METNPLPASDAQGAAVNRAQAVLLKKFQEGQLRNPLWSQRAFAQKIGVSSGALSEILKGKRTLSPAQKKKMAAGLQLSPQEQLDFFEDDLPQNLRPVRREYFQISMDQFHLISEWWHFAILNLLRTRGFKLEQGWISVRLGLQTKIVSEALDRLFRLGHLKRVGGKVVREHPQVVTKDEFFDLSVQKAHIENSALIERSVLENPLEVRDHTSVTLAINKKNMKRAKELIRIFQDQFAEEIEAVKDGDADEVYRLSISFFPLTRIKDKS